MMKKNLLLTGLLLIIGYAYGNNETKCPAGSKVCDCSAAPKVSPVEQFEQMTPEEAENHMEKSWRECQKMPAIREHQSFAELCSLTEFLRVSMQNEYDLLSECHQNDNCSQLIDQWKNIHLERLQIQQKGAVHLSILADLGYDFRAVMATMEISRTQKK